MKITLAAFSFAVLIAFAGGAFAEDAATPADPAVEAQDKAGADFLQAIDQILADAADQRVDAKKLPSKDDYLITPVWTETREDREAKVRGLLDQVLGIVTDVPIVGMQGKLAARRKDIRDIENQIAELKQKQLSAPKDALLPGITSDTVGTLGQKIDDDAKRIADNKAEIEKTKTEMRDALGKSGIKMDPEQMNLLFDSVLSGDLVRLVATFNAARAIDDQLSKAVQASNDNVAAARKFFAMHAALFAMLVHAQDGLIKKIDDQYLPRLDAIKKAVEATRKETGDLLKEAARDDQKKTLQSNLASQEFTKKVADYYRGYLLKQREQLAEARLKAVRDLKIADNTFETVEASFQLQNLIKDAAASFEAIQKLEAPGFDQIFENQDLRREFENLTRKLDVPTS